MTVLEDARHSLQRFDRALETGRGEEVLDGDRSVVREYNKDDCISTLELRNWLEKLREEQIAAGQDIERFRDFSGAAGYRGHGPSLNKNSDYKTAESGCLAFAASNASRAFLRAIPQR